MPNGREIDAHALRLDAGGNGLPAWDSEGLVFTRQDLAGEGAIAGLTVRCLTPEIQIVCHTGYDLPEVQSQDMARLRDGSTWNKQRRFPAMARPTLSDFLTNMEQPMPLPEKLSKLSRNLWRRVVLRQNCCGHDGEPGC